VPCWSKDGKYIYFGSNRSGTFQIWRMNADGSNPVMITKNGGFAAMVDATGESIYYAKNPALSSDIWKVPSAGGEETRITGGVYRYSFAPAPQGLYFVSAPQFQSPSSVRFLDFGTAKITDVLPVPDQVDLGLGISPKYDQLLFSKVDHSDADIMLVENVQ
jgi:Tol biopolymer transport system component